MTNEFDTKNENFPEFAFMPWDDTSELIIESETQPDEIITRWNFIERQLHHRTQIHSVTDLIDVIKSYNIVYDESGKQLKPSWKFSALVQYFEEVGEAERNEFFKQGGILGTIRNLCLQSKDLVPKVKLLKSGYRSCVSLHQLQIASLLANAFLCTYPKRDSGYPPINFNTLFEGPGRGNPKPYVEKIKCIVHYFRRINEKQPTGNVSFQRLCILDHKLPRWDKTTATLCGLQVEIQGKIEDQEGFLQMDFANRFVGGGVLGRGCVQEEIRFVICPELIAARLFTQCLADNEALLVSGAERYCQYRGFADTFEFAGDYRDTTPFDDAKHRKTYLIVLDALYFSHSSDQYRESKILRELKKAYVGFKPLVKSSALPLATGNWGCGAFRGDPQLKSILQLMASSQARRDILYLTFGDSSLKKQIDDLYKLLKESDVNVGTLYRIIRMYSRNKNKNQTLFDFIQDTIMNHKKRASLGTPQISGTGHPDSRRSDPESKAPSSSCKLSSRETSDIDADCGIVEKRIRMCSVSNDDGRSASMEPCPDTASSSQNKSDVVPKGGTTGDWVYDFGDPCSPFGNPPAETADSMSPVLDDAEMSEVPSPSLLSAFEVGVTQNIEKGVCQTKAEGLGEPSSTPGTPGSDVKLGKHLKSTGNSFSDVKAKARRLIQPKITDCFFKG